MFKNVSKSVCTRSLYVPFDDLKYSIIWHLCGPMRVRIMEFCCSAEKDTVYVKHITANILQSECTTLREVKLYCDDSYEYCGLTAQHGVHKTRI